MSSLFDIDLRKIQAYAHSHKNRDNELFHEHCERTVIYYYKTLKQFGVDNIFDHLSEDLEVNKDVIKKYLRLFVIFHDIGKLTDNFQKKLNGEKNKETHSDKSFFVLTHELVRRRRENEVGGREYFILFILLYSIHRHHGDLHNATKHVASFRFAKDRQKIKEISEYTGYQFSDDIMTAMEKTEFWERLNNSEYRKHFEILSETGSLSLFIFVKLFHSLLISSDYYATMEYMDGKTFGIKTFEDSSLQAVSDRFHRQKKLGDNDDDYNFNVDINRERETLCNLDIEQLNWNSSEEKKAALNTLRSKINVHAEETLDKHLEESPGENVFFLNVPTGGGKTNISMRLALKIMDKRNIRKLFYVFPFINIIEQTYRSLGKFLTDENMTRLDSRYISPDMKTEYDSKNLYANYIDTLFFNKPALFMSHVKFFDLFFRSDKNSNYNFFQIANSVVIIDEIQAYNDKVWTEISYLLRDIGKFMNTHFIVMSATLPKLYTLLPDSPCSDTRFIDVLNKDFNENIFRHELFRRTNLVFLEGNNDIYSVITEKSNKQEKVLIVLNTVKNSREMHDRLKRRNEFKNHELLLLNSTILENRKKEVIKKCDIPGKKLVLVSTQSVEAGVDIDFDIAFRAYAPVDSIVQVSGRVNRNSARDICPVYVFRDADYKKVYRGDVKAFKTREKEDSYFEMKDSSVRDITLIKEFYDEIIKDRNADNETSHLRSSAGNVEKMKNLFFQFVDRDINLIEGDTVSLYIPIDARAQNAWDEYKELIDEIDKSSPFEKILEIRNKRKNLNPYTINIFNSYVKGAKIKDFIREEVRYGMYLCKDWEKYYSIESGLDVDKFKEEVTGREALIL